MGRKKKAEQVDTKPEAKVFEYGDLCIKCKCGHINILNKGIEHGIQFVLTTREGSYIELACRECGAELRLCFLEGVKPEEEPVLEEPKTETEEKVNEDVQEDSNQEQSL